MDTWNVSTINLAKKFLVAQLSERNPKKAADCLTEDVLWLGAAQGRDVHSKAEALRYFTAEAEANPGTFDVRFISESENTVADGCGVAILRVELSGNSQNVQSLVTVTARPENDTLKICALHISVAESTPQNNSTPHFSLSKNFADNTYREFIENTISVAIVGAYDEEGFPFYTANRQFLDMLGYCSENEYKNDIGGLVVNGIHPDDKKRAYAEISAQLKACGNYDVKYRMRKKDGTYIRIEDEGKIVTAADGRRVQICICSDITEQELTIDRLNSQAEQLRLYRISQNAGAYRILVDDGFTLLYGNDRFFRIMEYTKHDFAEKLNNKCIRYVHPDDRAMVDEKIKSALTSNNKYTEWYMRVITGKNNIRHIHVIGNFIKTELGYVMEGMDIDVTAQKEIEQQLNERNAIYNVLLENSNVSMWTYDIKKHVATLISSKKHDRPMSYDGTKNYPESVISTGFIKDTSIEPLRELIRKTESGVETVTADIWFSPSDEEPWCDRITYVNIFDQNKNIIKTVGIAQDVTEQLVAQQRYEEELQYQKTLQNENLLTKVCCNITKNLIETYDADDSISICHDLAPYDESIMALSKTAFSKDESELILKTLNAKNIIEEFERGNNFISLEYRRKTHSNKSVWVNISSKTYRNMQSGDIKSFVYTTDIDTEKTNSEIIKAVASAEHDFIMLINLNTDEFHLFAEHYDSVIMPPQSGADYTEMSENINRLGVADSDVERAVHDMLPETIRENLNKQKLFSAAYVTRMVDNTENYKKIQYFWLDEESGLVILTRSDITDITREQQRQQMLLKSALRQAEQASNAKTDFLSKMSHEIRTPMNAIIGMNALAAQNINDTETASDCISKVGISARYLLTLINDILDMSRIESGKVNLRNEKIPFQKFINGVNTVIYDQASQNGLTYDSIITGNVSEYYMGDAMKLQQIIINLLGNSVKFTPRGGKIQLIISQEKTDNNTAYMKFTVNDTGVGISEEFQKVMFDPFEQEYNGNTTPYSGTGLGLTITKNLVDIMHGTISVNSIIGVGTEFVVNVPLGIIHDSGNQLQCLSVDLHKMKALVVDDEILICEQAKSILSEMGMKVQWVTSGRKAVETVQSKWAKKQFFDIILVDWKMPDMDGIETARQIRKIVGPDVTIIIITAYEWAEIESEAKAAGVNLLITKPLFKASLMSTFERIFCDKSKSEPVADNSEYDFTGNRVLLVEDHLLNVEVAKRLLQAKGMEVDTAENGLAAIESFASTPVGYYDVILMDIRMPVMDGLTATRSIRQMKKATAKNIPIIAMSANAFEEDVEKSREAGMNAHLAKPIEPQLLYHTLSEFVGKSNLKKIRGSEK